MLSHDYMHCFPSPSHSLCYSLICPSHTQFFHEWVSHSHVLGYAAIALPLHLYSVPLPVVQANTLDPGTVNTKMLYAGWGPIGIDVTSADNTFKLLTDPSVAAVTGAYFIGHRKSRQVPGVTQQVQSHQNCGFAMCFHARAPCMKAHGPTNQKTKKQKRLYHGWLYHQRLALPRNLLLSV